MLISDWSSDVCSSDLHWVLGVAAFGTTAHFRTDKPPLPRQPVCHRLEVAGIPGEAGKTEYRRTVRCPLIVEIVQTKHIIRPPISVFIFRLALTFPLLSLISPYDDPAATREHESRRSHSFLWAQQSLPNHPYGFHFIQL